MKKGLLYLLLFLLCACSTNKRSQSADQPPKYRYEFDLKAFEEDRIKVKLSIDNLDKESITYCFPKIVPGIYGAMDFGQYIQSMKVKDKDGKPLVAQKTGVNCWEISQARRLASIEYEVEDSWEVFDFELIEGFYRSAASSFSEEAFIINPNCLLGYFRELDDIPVELVVGKPEQFYGATSLKKISTSATQDKYVASSYHQLVDNPILYSQPDTTLIALPNIDIEVACFSTSKQAISGEIAQFIKPLLINQTAYLGGQLPVDKYTFILYHNLNPSQNSYMGDGLEHSHSTLILLYMPMDLNIIKETVYGIASHEFFHTLMPLGIHSHEIANYDFNDPQFSRHLWLYEGMTEYFTIHMPIQTGLQSLAEFLQELNRKLSEMKNFDNTLSFTKLSLNPMEMQDQYYNVYLKGALINLCLDIRLRELSGGQYGVQNLVMDLINKYGVDRAFEDEKLFDEIVALTGYSELKDFFAQYVVGAAALPLEESLQKVGLRIEGEKIVELSPLSDSQKALRKSWINQ